MKLLVTGARGFVGRHCLPLLTELDLEVHATTSNWNSFESGRTNVIWHQVDLLDVDQMEAMMQEIRPTHLLHLAWYTEHGRYWTDPVNYRWLSSSRELVRRFVDYGGKRAVVVGTCAEYEWNGSICRENDSLKPGTVYGKCKNDLRLELEKLAAKSGLSLAWGRLFFVFGPFEDRRRLIPSVINSLGSGEPALCGSGDLIRDFLYVEDAAGALVELVRSTFDGVVNIASGYPISIGDLVYAIADQMSARELVHLGVLEPRRGDPPYLVGDNTRLREMVGYEPRFELVEALKRTIGWWKTGEAIDVGVKA